ncbi:MAG: hypothetical protein ACYTEI_14060 [Planctomycetota bacterium]|jgi:uncharacterized HAD superfamily protein
MDLPSKAARLASGSHAEFKAEIYASTDTLLFIESGERQALEIARLSGRPVLCIETWQMVHPSLVAQAPVIVRNMPSLVRTWARRARRRMRRHLMGIDSAR